MVPSGSSTFHEFGIFPQVVGTRSNHPTFCTIGYSTINKNSFIFSRKFFNFQFISQKLSFSTNDSSISNKGKISIVWSDLVPYLHKCQPCGCLLWVIWRKKTVNSGRILFNFIQLIHIYRVLQLCSLLPSKLKRTMGKWKSGVNMVLY